MAWSSVGRHSVPEVYGHSWARLRSSVVLPAPDRPVMTSVSPGSSRTSSGSTSWAPDGVRTSTRLSSTEPSWLSTVVKVGSSRAAWLVSTRPCRRMIAAR